jgi:REP element-mobilizing transposase RayT
MTRLRRIEDRDRIFFVTTNLAPKVVPFIPEERDLILSAIETHKLRSDFLLFGYMVMPTHVHLLFSPQGRNLIQIMRDLKSKTGYTIAQRRNIAGPIWQERYFDTIIRQVRNFRQKLEYIHRNPVEAGLVSEPEEWHWSSYRQYVKKGEGLIALDPVEFPSDGDHFPWPAPWR